MTGATVPPPAPPAAPVPVRRWRAGRVVAIVIGSLLAIGGLAGVGVGGTLAWATATQRDRDGYFHTGTERLSTRTAAITTGTLDLFADTRPDDWGGDLGDLLKVRIRARSDGGAPVFVGIGRAADVAGYLRGVAHDVVRDVDVSPFRVTYRAVRGSGVPSAPTDESFWAASVAGAGRQTLTWGPEAGRWVVVIMNTDGARGVSVDVSLGVQVQHLAAIIAVIIGLGLVALVGGLLLVLWGTRRPPGAPDATGAEPAAAASGLVAPAPTVADPIVVTARLDEPLSRWLWLVKWFLAIPHFIVLAILWFAVFVVSVIAFFAILFTGRYPRSLFDFTVGVLRWTWRVHYYATGVLGTDRYPPFTFAVVPDYPAAVDVVYPAHLSRGLVLVKWWLLVLPQAVVTGIIGGGLWFGTTWISSSRVSGGGWAWGGGLLGILVLVALVRLLFTHRYPRDMWNLVVGLNRWLLRVAVYALLLTDTYPPFRLDQGDGLVHPVPPTDPQPATTADPGAADLAESDPGV